MSISLPNPKTEKEFEEYRKYLVLEATRLASFIALYRRLYERRGDRLEEMNIAPAFFLMATEALLAAIILWVDKLLKERGERGIFNFLSFIENNKNIFAIEQLKRRTNYSDRHWILARDPITLKTIKKDRECIQRLDGLQNIKTLRDKFYAHFDKVFFFDRERLAEVAPTWNDLEKMIEIISQVINRYSIAYDGREFSLKLVNINDLDSLLDRLYEFRKVNNS